MVPVCTTVHNVQQAPCACCGSVEPSCEEVVSVACEQMGPASGSAAASLSAQPTEIGAIICTNIAIKTIGRNFFIRRRILMAPYVLYVSSRELGK